MQQIYLRTLKGISEVALLPHRRRLPLHLLPQLLHRLWLLGLGGSGQGRAFPQVSRSSAVRIFDAEALALEQERRLIHEQVLLGAIHGACHSVLVDHRSMIVASHG